MLRQNNNNRGEKKAQEQRKDISHNAGRSSFSERTSPDQERNRADNTRVARLDPTRLNDLYERSSM